MATPTIKQLEAFYWAATSANFVAAARQVHLSVSSLSKRLQELEGALGQTLFDRSGHRAVLTDAGRQLMPSVSHVLGAMAELTVVLGSEAPLIGRARFGVGDLSAATWLPVFVQRVRVAHPGLELDIAVEVGGILEERVADGDLDFAVVAGRSSHPAIRSEPVTSARFGWVASPTLVGDDRPTIRELLRTHPLVTLPQGAGTSRIIDEWLLRQHVPDVTCIRCDSWVAVSGMLARGVGVGVLPKGWSNDSSLVEIGSRAVLKTLLYAFQSRRVDSRPLISVMHGLVRQTMDFSTRCDEASPVTTRR